MAYPTKFYPPQAISTSLAAAPSSSLDDMEKMRAELEEARRNMMAEKEMMRRAMEAEKEEMRRQVESQKANITDYMKRMEDEKERERKEKEEAEQARQLKELKDCVNECITTTYRPQQYREDTLRWVEYVRPQLEKLTQIYDVLHITYTFEEGGYFVPRFVITNTHLFVCRFISPHAHQLLLCPLYTFDQVNLNILKSILRSIDKDELVESIRSNKALNFPYISGNAGYRHLNSRLLNYNPHHTDWDSATHVALKKFESMIRIIPGSYQNGPWKQLDGFFGMYFNEETLEFTELIPPM